MQQLSYSVTHSARLVNQELIYREEHRRAKSFKLLARVLSITDAALVHVSLEELLNDLLNRIRKVQEFDVAAVLLKEPNGDTLLMQTPEGLKKESAGVIRMPGDKQFGRRVIGRCVPTIFDDIETDEEYSPIFREYGIRSAIGALKNFISTRVITKVGRDNIKGESKNGKRKIQKAQRHD